MVKIKFFLIVFYNLLSFKACVYDTLILFIMQEKNMVQNENPVQFGKKGVYLNTNSRNSIKK